MKKQFEHQVTQLMNELQHVKGEFTARLLEFKAIVSKVEENSVADAREKVISLEYALKKSKEEMEEAKQASKNKYSEMLAERTTKEEELMLLKRAPKQRGLWASRRPGGKVEFVKQSLASLQLNRELQLLKKQVSL